MRREIVRDIFPVIECAMICTMCVAACIVYEFAFNPGNLGVEQARRQGMQVIEPDGKGIRLNSEPFVPASGH